ncbi:hypothetical protein KFK09_014458 [Dendrobium nobile]|uniref:Uncharacterized protein n=1 Tax=Dendrobium nobile TaxID=94219 RepID=A0A8T3B247_DENNO|nr:hypothetical protein KFK09_014458 [Dendrobium nobile]
MDFISFVAAVALSFALQSFGTFLHILFMFLGVLGMLLFSDGFAEVLFEIVFFLLLKAIRKLLQ